MLSPIGERLVAARKMAGVSLQDLADRLDIDITRQALNKYEKGTARPSGETLVKIAAVLGVPVDYFYRTSTVSLGPVDFRKQSHLKASDIERIKSECSDFLERCLELEKLLNADSGFKNPLTPAQRRIKTGNDIEAAAEAVRSAWQLGSSPVPSVITMLEDNRIRVYETDAPDSFVGMSTWVGDIPVIVLNRSMNTQRKRFTALHELAHLILDFSGKMEKEIETFCHAFAGAFLLPMKQFIEWFGSKRTTMSVPELIMIDEHYGISVQAIMARAHHLGLITDTFYRDFNFWLSKSGKKKNEFGKYNVKETPQRFDRLLRKAVTEGIISESKTLSLSNGAFRAHESEVIS